MAGLDRIDPQGELVRRITELRAEVRRIGSGRRETAPFVQLAGGNGVLLAAGSNNVVLGEVQTGTAGWDGALPLITFPVAGVYLVVIRVPRMTTLTTCITGIGSPIMQVQAGGQAQQTVAYVLPFEAGQASHLTALMGADNTPVQDWIVNIVRLADTPEIYVQAS